MMERVREEDEESSIEAVEYEPSVVSEGMNERLLSLDAKLIKSGSNENEKRNEDDFFDE